MIDQSGNISEKKFIDSEKEYPGIRRLPYFLYLIGGVITLVVTLMVVLPLLGPVYVSDAEEIVDSILKMMIPVIIFSIAMLYITVLRLHNVGSTGWWFFGLFFPVLNIYAFAMIFAFPEGFNDHHKLDLPAKVMITIFIILLLVELWAIIYFSSQG
jgi:uncharacterized membrane protein YhaH (DUF805 family)